MFAPKPEEAPKKYYAYHDSPHGLVQVLVTKTRASPMSTVMTGVRYGSDTEALDDCEQLNEEIARRQAAASRNAV